MKGLRRFCTVFLGVILLAAGALALLCVNNDEIRAFWQSNLDYILDNFWVGSAVGCVLIVLGVLVVIVGVHIKKVMPFAKVSMGEFGQVDISLAAVDTVVNKVAHEIEGVQTVKTRIKTDNNGLSILLDVVMRSDCNIPETVALLQQNVKTQLETAVGLSVVSVKTAITNIAAAAQ